MSATTVWLVFLAIAWGELSSCQRFQNPVLDGADYPDPGVIRYNGVYYAATTTNNDKPEKYPIHTSTDLQNWTQIGYIFNASNFPKWSRYDAEFWAPEFHQIGDRFGILRVGVGVRDSAG